MEIRKSSSLATSPKVLGVAVPIYQHPSPKAKAGPCSMDQMVLEPT